MPSSLSQDMIFHLNLQSLTLASVRETLAEFLSSIGEEGNTADAERERNRVKRMLTALGYEGSMDLVAPPKTSTAEPVVERPTTQGKYEPWTRKCISYTSSL